MSGGMCEEGCGIFVHVPACVDYRLLFECIQICVRVHVCMCVCVLMGVDVFGG